MSDEEFEKFLQREAHSYNAPPATVPRDEMFAEIKRRKTGDGRSRMEVGRSRPRLAWIGMAATLLVGVGIGKYAFTERTGSTSATLASNSNDSAAAAAQQSHDSSGGTYAAAATAQLVRAEALLTAYTASASDAKMDKQLSTWARDLLTNTRLLLDSPAATDPSRRKLLEDLELVLVQMVQRSPSDGAANERAQIDRSIERNQVLSRLRSALPAGRPSGI